MKRGMPFEKGHPRFGGRKLGVTNKVIIIPDRIKDMGIDPLNFLLSVVKGEVELRPGEVITLRDKITCAIAAVRYMYPTLQTVKVMSEQTPGQIENKAQGWTDQEIDDAQIESKTE